jgi:hypothetical protein
MKGSFFVVSSIFGYLIAMNSAGAQALTATGKAVLLDKTGAGRAVVAPKWENGYFITFDIPDGGAAPSLYALDRSGKQVLSAPVVIPDSVETGLTDATVSQQGEFAIAGGATDAHGRSTAFIAFVDAKGTMRRLVRTSPFTPRRICFARDGTLWAVGWELDENGREKAAYDVLRQYGTDGVLMKSALPCVSLASSNRRSSPVSQSYLAASGSTVGIYSVSTDEWIEVASSTGAILGRWKGPNRGNDVRVRGAAVTGSGSVYVTSETRGTVRFAVYKLVRDSGAWQPVNGASGRIVGVDGACC